MPPQKTPSSGSVRALTSSSTFLIIPGDCSRGEKWHHCPRASLCVTETWGMTTSLGNPFPKAPVVLGWTYRKGNNL